MFIIFLLIFDYWSGNVAKRRETLKYGTFGCKKFGFRAMSQRILKLCVASLLNILCFPALKELPPHKNQEKTTLTSAITLFDHIWEIFFTQSQWNVSKSPPNGNVKRTTIKFSLWSQNAETSLSVFIEYFAVDVFMKPYATLWIGLLYAHVSRIH